MAQYSLQSLAVFLQEARRRYERAIADFWQKREGTGEGLGSEIDRSKAKALAAAHETAWREAETVFKEGQAVKGIVTGWNRGGLLVRWGDLQGFVPASQLKEMPVLIDDASRDEQLAHWVGEELALKIIELDPSRNRLVFSERATQWGPKDGDRLLAEVMPGEVRAGYVSNLCDFGAFVDLGGVDGLIHISELSWGRVVHPRELLSLGQRVEAEVLSVDKEARRIALSLKRLKADPWTVVEERYTVGQIIPATVTNIVDFGAFARIEEGLEGLVHISELSDAPVVHPSEVVQVGDKVHVRILRIDSANRRLGLSLRLDDSLHQRTEPSVSDEEWGKSDAPFTLRGLSW